MRKAGWRIQERAWLGKGDMEDEDIDSGEFKKDIR